MIHKKKAQNSVDYTNKSKVISWMTMLNSVKMLPRDSL